MVAVGREQRAASSRDRSDRTLDATTLASFPFTFEPRLFVPPIRKSLNATKMKPSFALDATNGARCDESSQIVILVLRVHRKPPRPRGACQNADDNQLTGSTNYEVGGAIRASPSCLLQRNLTRSSISQSPTSLHPAYPSVAAFEIELNLTTVCSCRSLSRRILVPEIPNPFSFYSSSISSPLPPKTVDMTCCCCCC